MAENSVAEPKRRGPGRPFAKGVSGNPGGRSRRAYGIEVALREAQSVSKVLAVVEGLRKAALAGDVQAAKVYLDRVAGPVRPNDEERVELRARELVEDQRATSPRLCRHTLTPEQINFMAENQGRLPTGGRSEALGQGCCVHGW